MGRAENWRRRMSKYYPYPTRDPINNYFPLPNEVYLLGTNNFLVKNNIYINNEKLEDKVLEILNYLKTDNKKIPNGLKGIIPSATKINSIKIGLIVLMFFFNFPKYTKNIISNGTLVKKLFYLAPDF